MLRKAVLVLVLALGLLAPALASGDKEASLDRYYAGGFFLYGVEGPEGVATASYYTGGFYLYRRIPAVIGFFYY